VKSSPNLTMVVHLVSPSGRYDDVYLRNYAVLNVKDELARIPGMGEVQLFGAGDYAMRVWLDPQKVAARGMTAGDVVGAIREQNVQVAAGVVGASHRDRRRHHPPARRGAAGTGLELLRPALAVEQQERRRHRDLRSARLERPAIVQRRARQDG
jgi:multidrug efflux pump subunit AcrB